MTSSAFLNDTKDFFWRFLELHLFKFTLLILLLICIEHYCLLNFICIIFISTALSSASFCVNSTTFTLCAYMALMFIVRSIYQFEFIPSLEDFNWPWNKTCASNRTDIIPLFNTTSKWVGLEKQNDEWIFSDVFGYTIILMLIGVQFCIKYRQNLNRKMRNLAEPAPGILFPNAQPCDFDKSLTDCFKYLLNYGFYKFGMEISLASLCFAAWLRMDLLGALLVVWLFVLISISRNGRKRLWPFLVFYLAFMLPLQYLSAIGLPSNMCIAYPWDYWQPLFNIFHSINDSWKHLNNNLTLFLCLSNYRMSPQRFSDNLKIDFILLAIISAQNRIFKQESDQHPAGSNDSIYVSNKYQLLKENPYYDFVIEQRSFVDFIKYIIFMYGHWITMIMTLCAGLGGTSLFALGYVILAFWMLWEGNNLYTMHRYTKTLSRWNMLAKYTVFIMLCKIVLQLIGCVFIGLIRNKQLCPVQQLFSIFCVNPLSIDELQKFFNELPKDDTEFSDLQSCSKGGDPSEATIGFDAVAFLFIIFQLRILHSWYFQRCMIEFRCEVIQANRGAVLINQLIEKEMREQTEHQNKKLREIKARTAAIRKRYEEQQRRSSGYGAVVFSPQTYGQAAIRPRSLIDIDDPLPSYDLRYAAPQTPSSVIAKRSGDYYMFDGDPEMDDLIEPVISFVPEVTPGAGDFDKLDPAQLLHTALGKDLDLIQTLDSVEEAEQIKDEKLRMIAAVAPSEKAREIAKLALQLRHQSPPKLTKEDDIIPSTSQEKSEKDEETDTTDGIPIIRLRKKRKPQEIEQQQQRKVSSEQQKQQSSPKEDAYSYVKALISFFQFIWKIMIAFFDWISAFLNRRSREHRYVAYVLNKEKEHLKEIMSNELYDGQISSSDLRERWESHNMHIVSSEEDIKRLENEAHDRWAERNVFARFINAVGNCICAHTDVICYSFAVFVHGTTAGLLTLPLPALVFFWGTLANPRPSKFFWVTMIIYTEIEIVIKFAFQFGFWDWNSIAEEAKNSHKIYKLQYIFGVQRVEYFAVTDVALLIALFFHRYMLRKLGLWRDANSDRLLNNNNIATTQIENNNNSSSNEQSPNKNKMRNGSSATNDTSVATTTTASSSDDQIILQEIVVDNIDVESGQQRIILAAEQPSLVENSKTLTPPKISQIGIIGNFIEKLIYPKFRYICDFYPLMFFLDIFCMLIIAFGYSSFGEGGTGDVVSDIKSNRIPITLVVIILVQSLMIVLDRGLYLRKAVVAKLVYHLLTLIIVHVWIFFILPLFTQKEAYTNGVARFLYYIKCIYFLISAWQIRNGYPSLCIGNLLTHSYGLINMVLFKIFMMIPFVFELRTAIDWTWTDTSMPIFDFFNMENFYAVVYNLKCARKFEEAFPAPRGEPKGTVIKYLMGLPLILIMILLVWSPIIAFALINTIGNISPPESAIMTVTLEGFPPLYKMEAKGLGLMAINQGEYNTLISNFSDINGRESELNTDVVDRTRKASAYITQYTAKDILRVKFRPESETFWQISPVSLVAFRDFLQNNNTGNLELSFNFEFKRPQEGKKEPQIHSFTQKAKIQGSELLDAIDNRSHWFQVLNALPTYLVIPSEGEVQIAKLLQRAAERRISSNSMSNITRTFNHWKMRLVEIPTSNSTYWLSQMEFNENITKLTAIPAAELIEYGGRDLNYTEFLALVDRVFPSWLNSYVQGGIVLMYAGIVLFVGRLIRGFVSSQPLDVIINEIPNPDHLLKICLDIYLVREARDFILEQDLFAKLIFLFRSPQTLIRWTRYKTKPE